MREVKEAGFRKIFLNPDDVLYFATNANSGYENKKWYSITIVLKNESNKILNFQKKEKEKNRIKRAIKRFFKG